MKLSVLLETYGPVEIDVPELFMERYLLFGLIFGLIVGFFIGVIL